MPRRGRTSDVWATPFASSSNCRRRLLSRADNAALNAAAVAAMPAAAAAAAGRPRDDEVHRSCRPSETRGENERTNERPTAAATALAKYSV